MKTATGKSLTTKLSNRRKLQLIRLDRGGFQVYISRRRGKKDPEYLKFTKSMQTLKFGMSDEAMKCLVKMYIKFLEEGRTP